MFSDSYVDRLNFIYSDQTALACRSIEPPFTKPSSYASVATGKQETVKEAQVCNESMKT